MAKNVVFRHLRTSAQSIPERYRGVAMVFGASLAIYHYEGDCAGRMDFADLLLTLDFSDRLIYYTRKEVTHKLPTHEYNFGGEQMSRFYCREDELQKLNKRYAGDKF